MEKETDYELDKQKKKQKLVRNEFLYNSESTGKYEIPKLKKQDIDISKIQFLSYVDTKINDTENNDKTIHFFTYDWKFKKVYENAEEELEKLKQYKYLLTPDFSMFTNMPVALQIESVFKNRWCGAYWQSKGLKVIPTISWGDEKSFDFCFEGIEEGSVVAVCTYYRENCEEEFMLGYNKMLEKIKPSAVICYDEPFEEMKGNIISFLPTAYEWIKNLSPKDQVQFMWEKHNRNISGLNPKDFKFFKYEDPYAKSEIVKCSICGGVAVQDKYGNGECNNCGWKFSKDEDDFEKKYHISYPMLVSPSRAREQYKQGKPFKASFEDFVNGLYFYSEMLFDYKSEIYEVFFKPDYIIVLCSKNMQQEYKTRKDFEEKANINGKLLKAIWNEVINPRFMSCG